MARKAAIVRHGTNKNDLLSGSNDDETFYGGAGDDRIFAGGGNDRVNGDQGNDTLDGGGGSDVVDGGTGNDLLIYVAAENRGSRDDYDGGAGSDRLQLVLTREEWMRSAVQGDIARYLAFLASHVNPSGQATGHSFGFSAFGLEARKIEALEVKVDGVLLDARDQAIDARDDTARVSEDAAQVTGNVVTGTSAAGADLVPDLLRSIQLVSGPAGGAIVNSAGTFVYSGTGHGTLRLDAAGNFTYSPGAAFNSLRAGQTATETFTYRITDADGDSDTARLTITVVGANDAPLIGATVANRVVDPSAPFQFALPANAFTDPEGDALTYRATLGSGSPLPAWLRFNAATRTFSGTPGIELIGEAVVVQVSASDGNGGSASQTFTLRVAGTLITGTPGIDTLTGTAGRDRILGLGGNDDLHGGGAADLLDGGAGDDQLNGDAGDDVLVGGTGNDRLVDTLGNNSYFGGDGDDFIQNFNGGGSAVMDGGAGSDFIWAQGLSRVDVNAGAGDDRNVLVYFVDTATIDLGEGNDGMRLDAVHATVSAGTGNDQVVIDGGSAIVDLGAGRDEVWSYSALQQTVATGAGRDMIVPVVFPAAPLVVTDFTAGPDGDLLEYSNLAAAFVGWDHATNPFAAGYVRLLQAGASTLFQIDVDGAANGQSFVTAVTLQNVVAAALTATNFGPAFDLGGSPDVTLVGSNESDTLRAGFGNDTLLGRGGNDFLYGFGGNDTLDGGDGDDYIDDGGGDNRFFGGAGNDFMRGGDGNDFFEDDEGSNIFVAGGGNDTVRTASAGAAYLGEGDNFFHSTAAGVVYVTAGSGYDQIVVSGATAGSLIDAGDGPNIVSADFEGTILSGAGDDQISAHGNVVVSAGGGNDGVFLFGSGSADGAEGTDVFFVHNSTGHVITTGTGADRIAVVVLNAAPLVVTDFVAGAGGDILDLSWIVAQNLPTWDLSSNPFGNFLRVVQSGTDALVQIDTDGAANGQSFTSFVVLQNVAAAALTADNVWPHYPPGGGPVPGITRIGFGPFEGGLGNDVFVGSSAAEAMFGDAGDDFLDGREGDDTLDGGYGVDVIIGGDGNDAISDGVSLGGTIDAGIGDDFVISNAAAGTIDLGGGNDTATLAGGTTLTTGGGADRVAVYGGGTLAVTTITDFALAGAERDVLDLRDVLTGFDPFTSNLPDFVTATASGSSTMIAVNRDGIGADFVDVVRLQSVSGFSLDALIANGSVVVA